MTRCRERKSTRRRPSGRSYLFSIRNGNPAKCLVVNTTSGATEKEFALPVGNTNANGIHGQFRTPGSPGRARCWSGTWICARLPSMTRAARRSSLAVPDVWMAAPLDNGNILMTREHTAVREFLIRQGQVVWEFARSDLTALGYQISGMQTASRLANGDTLIDNWCPKATGRRFKPSR